MLQTGEKVGGVSPAGHVDDGGAWESRWRGGKDANWHGWETVGRQWETRHSPAQGWGLGGWRRQAGGLDRGNGRASPQLSAIGPAYR